MTLKAVGKRSEEVEGMGRKVKEGVSTRSYGCGGSYQRQEPLDLHVPAAAHLQGRDAPEDSGILSAQVAVRIQQCC